MTEKPRASGSMSSAQVLDMILNQVNRNAEEMRLRFSAIESKLDEQARDNRKYTDTRLKELDERIKEREASEVAALKEANALQDKAIAELKANFDKRITAIKTEVKDMSKWSEGVKAKWALIVGMIGLASGGIGTALFTALVDKFK